MMLKLIALSLAPFLVIVLAALIRPSLVRGLRATAIIAVLALAVLSTPLVSSKLLNQLEHWAPLDTADVSVQGAQAIVILAAEQRPRPEFGGFGPGQLSLERLRYGAFLAKRTGLPVLVSGGDPGEEGAALAVTLATALEGSFGVRAKWREGRSLNTVGNAQGAAAILEKQGVRKVLLVTHAWHMPRARLAFDRAGLQVIPAPTAGIGDPFGRIHGASDLARSLIPQISGLQTSYYFIHEAIGLALLKSAPA
jgi:uncharacterized SAM-binding protein YcdF (DUF218 family)